MSKFDYSEQYYETGIGGFHEASFAPISNAFKQAIPPVSDSLEILDFGCGNGFYGAFLRQSATRLDGVDYSLVLPNVKNRRFYQNFYQQDLGKEWQPETKYDAVFSVEVIEHVEDYHQFLANAFAALKPGGRLFLTTTTYFWSLFILLIVYRRQTSFASLSEFFQGLAGDENARTRFVKRFWDFFTGHYHGFTKGQLRRGLEAAGFVVERLDYLQVQDVFPVHYLDQPYNKKYKMLVNRLIPCIKVMGRSINWACRRFDLNAPNVVVIARKPPAAN